MKFSENGIPILTMEKKLDALRSQIEEERWEDTLGHLGDLFHHALTKLNAQLEADGQSRVFTRRWHDLYFANPTPIEEDL